MDNLHDNNAQNLKSLGGGKTDYPQTYAPQVLESFDNKYPDTKYVVELDCTEFTALCPKTQQPDFAKIKVRYSPDTKLVESKSMKLYLFSFRNHGSFHENVVNMIARDLFELLKPHWIEVQGYFMPRGGISINPFVRLEHRKSENEALMEAIQRDGVGD